MSAEPVLIEKVKNSFTKAINRWRLSNFKYCMRAGACAYVCHFWLTEPRHELVPGIKGKRVEEAFEREFGILKKIKMALFRQKLITQEELEKWKELSYAYCSLCDRCRLACPYSVEFPPLTFFMRIVLHDTGMTPESVKNQTDNEFNVGHPYGLTKEDWLKFIDEVQSEIDGEVPVDKKGAKFLIVPGKRSLIDNKESFISLIQILIEAKEDFTLSSDLWTICMSTWEIGAWGEMKKLTESRAKIIEDLGVKVLLTSNDGCGYYGWRWEASSMLGRSLNFDVMDITELVYQYLREGRLKLDPKANDFRATYHDPCHLARKSGIVKEPREVIKRSVKEFVEMPHNGIYSVCCTAGCLRVDEYQDTRLRAFKVKLDEVKATKADAIITACDECYATFSTFLPEYNEKYELIDFTTLVARALS